MKYWFKNIKYIFDVLSSDSDWMMLIKIILCDNKYQNISQLSRKRALIFHVSFFSLFSYFLRLDTETYSYSDVSLSSQQSRARDWIERFDKCPRGRDRRSSSFTWTGAKVEILSLYQIVTLTEQNLILDVSKFTCIRCTK